MYKWDRYSDNGYEVSSAGDKRFSAFYAILPDGRSIEEHYQVDIKGYNSIKEGKGNPPKREISRKDLYKRYKDLWRKWAENNEALIIELAIQAKNKVLTDKFAKTKISQARALCEILNENFL